jgi:ribosomal silencing factor RsfS
MVLVDLEGIVVHSYSKRYRDYYQLEELWSDSHTILWLMFIKRMSHDREYGKQ